MRWYWMYVFCILLIGFIAWTRTRYEMPYVERFSTSNPAVVLVGDSILNNRAYVKPSGGLSVEEWLAQLLPERVKLVSYAKNHATIYDTIMTIQHIPDELDREHTHLFLSVGGNDLLSSMDPHNEDELKRIQNKYKQLIHLLLEKYPLINIHLLNLYYPNITNRFMRDFHPVIKKWNGWLEQFASLYENIRVLPIGEHITNKRDLVADIEPSINGGKKIAELIVYRTLNPF